MKFAWIDVRQVPRQQLEVVEDGVHALRGIGWAAFVVGYPIGEFCRES